MNIRIWHRSISQHEIALRAESRESFEGLGYPKRCEWQVKQISAIIDIDSFLVLRSRRLKLLKAQDEMITFRRSQKEDRTSACCEFLIYNQA